MEVSREALFITPCYMHFKRLAVCYTKIALKIKMLFLNIHLYNVFVSSPKCCLLHCPLHGCTSRAQALLSESAFNQRSLNQRMREATVTQIYPGIRQRLSGLHPILLLTV